MYFIDQSLQGGFIEVHVCNGCKQPFDQQFVCILCRFCITVCCTGKTDQGPGQLILKGGNISLFAANSRSPHTTFASGCLLTLKTKHFSFHLTHSPYSKIRPSVEIVTTCQGMNLPLALSAFSAAL